jgi:hypothetical protein
MDAGRPRRRSSGTRPHPRRGPARCAGREAAGPHPLPGPRHARRTCARGHRPRVRLRRARPHASELAGPPRRCLHEHRLRAADHAERGRDLALPDPRLRRATRPRRCLRPRRLQRPPTPRQGPRCRPRAGRRTRARRAARGAWLRRRDRRQPVAAGPSPPRPRLRSHARSSTAGATPPPRSARTPPRASPPGTHAAVRSAPHGARRCLKSGTSTSSPARRSPPRQRSGPTAPPPARDERRSPAHSTPAARPACACEPRAARRRAVVDRTARPHRRLRRACARLAGARARDRRAADGLVGVALAAHRRPPRRPRSASPMRCASTTSRAFSTRSCRAG